MENSLVSSSSRWNFITYTHVCMTKKLFNFVNFQWIYEFFSLKKTTTTVTQKRKEKYTSFIDWDLGRFKFISPDCPDNHHINLWTLLLLWWWIARHRCRRHRRTYIRCFILLSMPMLCTTTTMTMMMIHPYIKFYLLCLNWTYEMFHKKQERC